MLSHRFTRVATLASLASLALTAAACDRVGIDRRDEHGMSALMYAAKRGDRVEAERLINGGADVNARVPTRAIREMIAFISWMQQLPSSDVGYTPLHYAVQEGHLDVATLLLARGAKVDNADGDGTPLHLAIMRSNVAMSELLMDAGARPTPGQLALAITQSSPAIVRLLLARGVDPNGQAAPAHPTSPAPPPALIAAVMTGDTAIVRSLLDAGADVNGRDRNGWTPIRWARHTSGRQTGSPETVAAMIEAAGGNDEAGKHADALFQAIFAKNEPGVREALRAGATADARDESGVEPLVYAAGLGLLDAVAALIDAGANVNVSPRNRTTPLIAAIEGGGTAIVKRLLDAGARVDQPDAIRLTPLVVASRGSSTEIMELLLAASRSAQSAESPSSVREAGAPRPGPTTQATLVSDPAVLAGAALSGSLEQVQLLLRNGADPNGGGKGYVLNEATRGCMRADNTEIVRALLDAGANANPRGADMSPLHRAAGLCPIDAVRLLLAHGADPNAREINGATPIMLAAFDGRVDVLRLLIDAHADVNARDDGGKTVVRYAERHPEAVQVLRAAGAR